MAVSFGVTIDSPLITSIHLADASESAQLIKARSHGKHSDAESAAMNDDPSVEEGLLANHTEDSIQDSKDVELTSIAVTSPEPSEDARDNSAAHLSKA